MIHVVMPFSRPNNIPALHEHLEGLGVVWHPIIANVPWPEEYGSDWIDPMYVEIPDGFDPFAHKLNTFAALWPIVDGDRYCMLCDDDMFGPGYVETLRSVSGRIVVTSMKRGQHVPNNGREHPATTLIGSPANMRTGLIGIQQCPVTGDIFKQFYFPTDEPNRCDGIVAEWLRDNYLSEIIFMPDLFILFNRLQPGRWDA